MEGGGGAGHLGKVLSCVSPGSDVVWGGDVSAVINNGEEVRDIACGVPETGDKVKVKEAEVTFMA